MTTKTKYIIEGENRTEHLFNQLDRDVQRFDKRMSSLSATGLAVGAAIAAAFGGAKLIGTLREFGTLTASLETVTGSAEGAQAALAWIEPFAATTPFQLEELVGAFIKLEARGLKPSEAALRSYGNTAAAMGKSLDQFVEAVADATTGEFERLLDFGIKARTEGDRVQLTFRGVSSTIRKEASAIERYLRDLGDTVFAGGMVRQAVTLDGALSNLEDSVSALVRAMGDAGLTMVISDGARAMSVLAKHMADAVREGDGLLRVFHGLGSGIADLAHGPDQQALAQVELDIMALEQRMLKFQTNLDEQSDHVRAGRLKRIQGLQEEIDLLEKRRQGYLAVLQPEQFGAAPRTPTAGAPASTGGDSGTLGDTKAFEKAQKEAEKFLKENAKLQREFERDMAKLLEAQARDAVKVTEELRASQEGRLRDLERSLLSERELVQANLEERLQLVRVARAQELDATMEYAELEKRVREDAAKDIAQIEKSELDALNKDAEQQFEALTRAVQGWGDDATEAILDFATGAETSFGNLVDSILRDIARLAIRKTLIDPLGNVLFGDSKENKGLLGSLVESGRDLFTGITGARATGGPAFRGQPLLVGEQGRELFVPSTTGSIVPMSGGGVTVKVEVINASQEQVRVEPGELVDGQQNIRVIIGEIVEERLASGALDRSFGENFGTRRTGVNR